MRGPDLAGRWLNRRRSRPSSARPSSARRPVSGVAGLIPRPRPSRQGSTLRRRRAVAEAVPSSGARRCLHPGSDSWPAGRRRCRGRTRGAARRAVRPEAVSGLATKLVDGTKAARGSAAAFAPLAPGEGATSLALAVAIVLGRQRPSRAPDRRRRRGCLRGSISRDVRASRTSSPAGPRQRRRVVARRRCSPCFPAGPGGMGGGAAQGLCAPSSSRLAPRFDLVLLDGPSFADGVAAPTALAGASDGLALVVAGWDGLMRHDFVGAIDAMANRPDFLGVVLNRTSGSSRRTTSPWRADAFDSSFGVARKQIARQSRHSRRPIWSKDTPGCTWSPKRSASRSRRSRRTACVTGRRVPSRVAPASSTPAGGSTGVVALLAVRVSRTS